MRSETRLIKEMLKEIKENRRLMEEMIQSFSNLSRKLAPQKHESETILKGRGMAEIIVRTPEKLEEWKELFECRGLRVEYYEPFRTNGEEYFAKLWGHLDGRHAGKKLSERVSEGTDRHSGETG